MELDLWLAGTLVAHTRTPSRGGKVKIVYADEVAGTWPPETPLLSCSLPIPGPGEPARSRAFLEGLLPEGSALAAAAAQVRGVRLVDGAPETAADAVALLGEFGRECAGAIVALPAGHPPPTGGRYEALDEAALGALVRDLPLHPIGTDLARDIRMSLAGAQPKFLLARISDLWYEPVAGAPSTHILKPTGVWAHSAHNEALVLALARACGLTTSAAWTETMGETAVLVAERYDRAVVDGQVVRRHQEDMCQAVGIRPSKKYEIGRPSERMARLLREFTDEPRVQLAALFRQVAFRATVGDEDGHGKNYSVLLDNGTVQLSPLYDSLCTLAYPDLTGRMATKIGAQQSLAKIDRQALIIEGRAMGLTEVEANSELDAIAFGIRTGLDALPDKFTTGWPSERVIDIILARCTRLTAGEPLGAGPATTRRSAALTLDDATEQRQTIATRPDD
ncbi:HipA domain-containing protein [Jatrophihabitans sp.]|uniref:HipA domain-containing protein n=1 Tax=Jatrophihabitans sp. TaxID=1932789 RepID=UPI002C8F381A|nr:HipA domain-containing protein [Jatrophihabitans sp.]